MTRPDDPPPPLPGTGRPRSAEPAGDLAPAGRRRPSVRTTTVRVLVVQAVTLALLGLLQWGFSG